MRDVVKECSSGEPGQIMGTVHEAVVAQVMDALKEVDNVASYARHVGGQDVASYAGHVGGTAEPQSHPGESRMVFTIGDLFQ